MNCRVNGGKTQSKNKVIEFMITATAYALFEHGYEGEKVKKILEDIEEVASLMTENYVKFGDIQKALKAEYDFTLDFQ